MQRTIIYYSFKIFFKGRSVGRLIPGDRFLAYSHSLRLISFFVIIVTPTGLPHCVSLRCLDYNFLFRLNSSPRWNGFSLTFLYSSEYKTFSRNEISLSKWKMLIFFQIYFRMFLFFITPFAYSIVKCRDVKNVTYPLKIFWGRIFDFTLNDFLLKK